MYCFGFFTFLIIVSVFLLKLVWCAVVIICDWRLLFIYLGPYTPRRAASPSLPAVSPPTTEAPLEELEGVRHILTTTTEKDGMKRGREGGKEGGGREGVEGGGWERRHEGWSGGAMGDGGLRDDEGGTREEGGGRMDGRRLETRSLKDGKVNRRLKRMNTHFILCKMASEIQPPLQPLHTDTSAYTRDPSPSPSTPPSRTFHLSRHLPL